MSEKSLTELIETRLDIEGIRLQDREDGPWIAMFNARIRRAEAAERVAEAWFAWDEDYISSATWDAYAQALAAYKDAREAVRKLEGTT